MDTLCSAGKNAQEKEQGPQGYFSGGVDVGNGACHGYFHPWKPEVDCLLRPGKDVEGQDEPSGPLAGGLNISSTVEELCLGPGMAGDLLQGQVDVELSLDKRLDLELEGMSRCPESSTDHPHSQPSCPCETTGGDRRGAYQSVVEPTALCLDTSSCQEDGAGSDLEGLEEGEERGTRDGEKAEGQDELEEEDEEYQDRSGDNEGRDSRSKKASGFWRSRGGKRGRGGGEPNQQPASLPSSGGRHKQARRRNHHHHQHGKSMGPALTWVVDGCRRLVSEFLCQWCMSYLRVVAELIVLVAHRCGEAVEFAGAALYDSGSQLLSKATDLPAIKAEAGCQLQRMRRAAEALVAWTTKMAASSHRACVSCFSVLHVAVLLGSWWLSGLLGRLGGERGRRWWAGVCRSRAGTWVAGILDKVRAAIWKCRSRASSFTPKLASEKGKSYPGQELERLLALAQIPEDELDPFAVLGVEASATDPELKRAYRQLAVLVHPDKNKHPRAGEAFKVLRAAWDIVSNPETRREYQLKRMAETELSKSMNEFLTKLQDDLKEAMNTMMCTRCEGKHKRFEMERDPSQARFCADCNKCHSAEEGDFWAESSMLGLRITYFAFIDGKVYDITEWAGCQRIGISPDTHRVPYHISFGSKSNTSATRQRAPSEPPPSPGSPADLQDFFNRIFQGAPPDSMAANGGFFPATPPPPSHQHPGPSGVAPSPQQPGTFAPGGPRAEGGKAPRRKKKVRRPFQR